MSMLRNLVGQRFGKLTVLRRAKENAKSGNARWVCRCDCGSTSTVIGSQLRRGHTTSCGCNRLSKRAMGYSHERLYRIWTGMHRRCYNPTHDRHQWYGNKGVTVCDEWHDFLAFRTWALKNGYEDELTIDRVDSDGNYEPANCRWVDIRTQANNRSNNRLLVYKGKEYTATELAEAHGMSPRTIYNRLRLGWSVNEIVKTPERGSA